MPKKKIIYSTKSKIPPTLPLKIDTSFNKKNYTYSIPQYVDIYHGKSADEIEQMMVNVREAIDAKCDTK